MEANHTLLVNIIQDHILWKRITDKIQDMLNVFNPSQDGVYIDVANQFKGIASAFLILDVAEHKNLCLELEALMADVMFNNPDADATVLATKILCQWETIIKYYLITKKAA